MMVWWADQEDEGNDRFPKCNNDKQGNSNNNVNKSQRNNSGNLRKCKSDQEVTTVERNPWGKKWGTIKHSLRKSCTNDARCTRSHNICSSSVSALATQSTPHSFLKTESGRIRGTMYHPNFEIRNLIKFF
jgi:hypothetical protein